MGRNAGRRIFFRLLTAIAAPMLGLLVAGQTSLVENIEVCAGQRNLSAKLEIEACSAIIKSSGVKPQGLAIAYNNRGNAYIKQG